MKQITKTRVKPTPQEVEQITAEYRRAMYEKSNPAVMVYVPEFHACPWADCDTKIAAITFDFEHWADQEVAERLRHQWWLGPGVAGRCPGCRRLVLFGFQFKRAVEDADLFPLALMPDDWIDRVRMLPKRKP